MNKIRRNNRRGTRLIITEKYTQKSVLLLINLLHKEIKILKIVSKR